MLSAAGPGVTVLQLDTAFPRVPGDVAAPETYACQIEVIRIPSASVRAVVRRDPEAIDMAPFEAAIARAKGAVITTSCGFLAPWQDHLQSLTDRPVLASALAALRDRGLDPQATLTVTFDADALTPAHFSGPATDVVGLAPDMHLRQVIAKDQTSLDPVLAGQEVSGLVAGAVQPHHTHLLFECTNLPPYKPQVRAQTALPIVDILTELEKLRPGSVRPEFL